MVFGSGTSVRPMHLFGLNCDHDYQSGLPVGYRLATVIYGWLASIRGRCLVALLSSQHTAIIFFREQLQTAIKNRPADYFAARGTCGQKSQATDYKTSGDDTRNTRIESSAPGASQYIPPDVNTFEVFGHL